MTRKLSSGGAKVVWEVDGDGECVSVGGGNCFGGVDGGCYEGI